MNKINKMISNASKKFWHSLGYMFFHQASIELQSLHMYVHARRVTEEEGDWNTRFDYYENLGGNCGEED